MAQTTWYYPTSEVHTAPKQFRCSGCHNDVYRGELYTRTNLGRYCLDCLSVKAPKAPPDPEDEEDTKLEPEEIQKEIEEVKK